MKPVEELITDLRTKRNIKLTGKCLQCGKCCKGLVKIYSIKENTVELVRIETKPCYYYNKKTKTCKNYKNRTAWCTMFPYVPEVMYEGCGYKFEEIGTSKELKAFKEQTKDEISKLDYKKYFYQFDETEKMVMVKDLKDIQDYFKTELELDVYPVYGTLLGMVRDNDFIGWDTDIDIAYLSKCHTKTAVLNEWHMICDYLRGKYLLLKQIKTASHAHIYSPNKHLRVDLWISWIDEEGKYHLVWTVYGDLNGDMILPFKEIEYKGQIIRMMNDPLRFLDAHYKWQTPTIGGTNEWAKRKPVFELEQWKGE